MGKREFAKMWFFMGLNSEDPYLFNEMWEHWENESSLLKKEMLMNDIGNLYMTLENLEEGDVEQAIDELEQIIDNVDNDKYEE